MSVTIQQFRVAIEYFKNSIWMVKYTTCKTQAKKSSATGICHLLVRFRFIILVYLSFQLILSANCNKYNYAKYGNRDHNQHKNRGLNLVQWNKGNSLITNRLHDIHELINTYKPDILSLSEANLNNNVGDIQLNIPGYKIERPLCSQKTNNARCILIIKDSINYKCRLDLENYINTSIWVQIHIPGKKAILINGGYR